MKASKICNHFLVGGHIVHFYNWDRPLDLVPVMYDLIELIIEASLWTKDYSTFDTHTTHKIFVQWMLISFVWLYMFKCDVYIQFLVDQTQKDFWVFYMFLKMFLCFRVLSFCPNCIFHVFHQKLLQRHFYEKLATKPFPRKWVKAKYENTKFKQKLSQLSHYYFGSKVFLRKVLCFRGIFRK